MLANVAWTYLMHEYYSRKLSMKIVNEQGQPVHVDMERTFAILKKHGYKGYCSIEYDAAGDPYKPTAELIEQTIRFLS